MDNPVGGIKRGWEQIRSVSSGKYRFEFYHYSYHEAGDVFYVVGRERGEYRAGEVVLHMGIRTSEVFRRIDGEWRQIHHHGSIEDSQLLAAYVCLRDWRLCRAKPTFVISRVKTFPILKSCTGWPALIRNSHIRPILPLTCRAAAVASFRGQIAPCSVYSELSDVSAVTLLARFASHSRMSREHFSDSTRFRW